MLIHAQPHTHVSGHVYIHIHKYTKRQTQANGAQVNVYRLVLEFKLKQAGKNYGEIQ